MKRKFTLKRTTPCILTMLLLFLLCPSAVCAEESGGSSGDITLAPYFFIEGADPSTDSFPLKETKVSVNINGTIAETYVTQTYSNEGQNPINASYVFPASSKVTIHGMKMEIGNEVITAKIKEKEEAKQEFEEAKNEGKSASLLEQQRPNVFTMDVANIMPGDIVRIELHYTELITAAEGIYQFVFPTVAGPRYISPFDLTDENATVDWAATPYLNEDADSNGKYDIDVNLSAGVPVTGLSCKSHDVNIAWNNQSTAQITLADSKDFAGNRDYILEYKLTGQEMQTGLMLHTGEDENFFMLMVQPPERCKPEEIPPREYIFVVDVSGSMYGYPLDTAKELIRNLVSNLRETDSFNLILFSGNSALMSPKSLPATDENIEKAISLIDKQEGGGGTELLSALENAVALPADKNISRSIITLTDGYLFGETKIFDLIRENLNNASFFSFGIGSSVNRYLIDGIAKSGMGESFVVTDPDDAKNTAERFRTYIESPVLTDIHVSFNGFDAYDIEPAQIPTLFAQRPIVLFGKWRGKPTGSIQISGVTGNKDYVQTINAADVTPLASNNAIKYLWARTKVERLTDYGLNAPDQEEVKKEVTEIGLKYSMMTPYTSFIAVSEIVRNKDKKSTDVDQPLPLPSHVSSLAVGTGYTLGSEPEGIMMLCLTAAIVSFNLVNIWRRQRKQLLRKI